MFDSLAAFRAYIFGVGAMQPVTQSFRQFHSMYELTKHVIY